MGTKVTREELYELVWKTPMSRLAHLFGVSDVALAKTCKSWNVPRPGRGYWAQKAAGLPVQKDPLPAAPDARERWLVMVDEPLEPAPPPAPRRASPKVSIPQNLKHAHDVIAELGALLGNATRDEHDRLVVPGPRHAVLAVSLTTHRRALLLLDALTKSLIARAHEVLFKKEGEQFDLVAVVHGQVIPFWVEEHLDSRPHQPTDDEKQRIARGMRHGIRKHDYFASGRLQLYIGSEALARHSWSDTATKSLERTLGSVVLAMEDEIDARHRRRLEAEEWQRQQDERRRAEEEEKRRVREREALAKHREALTKELKTVARTWAEAQELRGFLAAMGAAIPVDARDEQTARWLEWAHGVVRSMDPLTSPEKIAKGLEPMSTADAG
jgi:hypothetical protein